MRYKLIYFLIAGFLAMGTLVAQELVEAEYFFEQNDPGIGNGTPITLSVTGDDIHDSISLDVTSLSLGYHWIFIRIKDTNNQWSIAKGHKFYVFDIDPAAPIPEQPEITGVEYFIDDEPETGNGTWIPANIQGDTIEQDYALNTIGLAIGYHWLHARAKDADGKWSIVKGHKFYVFEDASPNITPNQPEIAGVEYFLDDEPGVGNGIWIPADVQGDTIQKDYILDTDGLSTGFHSLYARAKDTEGNFGLPMARKFYIFEDTVVNLVKKSSPITAAEYFFDNDVPFGQGIAIPVSKGDSVDWTGPIDVTGLLPGEHLLVARVQDSVGIWSIAYSKSFSVVGLSSITNSPICQGSSNGEATISITGGKPPFTYLWDDPELQSDSTATGLKVGYYTVTVQDAEGAIIKETIEITEFDTIQISITTSDTDCKLSQGGATAIASGENPPFNYLWTSGSDEASASGLSSGIYEVTVTDNTGCQNKAVATINDIGGPQISTDGRILHLNCAGDANGIIDPEISGGTSPYTFSWSNGETTKGILNLKAGSYELTVLDADGCIATKSVKVEGPQPITFSLSVDIADCGSSNGTATVNVSGGTPQYAFNWTGFSAPHNASRTGLGAGVYEVNVTDSEGCSAIAQIAVSEKGAPTVNVIAVNQTSCGVNDGSILISVAGGTGSYTYDWKGATGSTVGSSMDLTSVGAGEYNVSVSDGSGCKTYTTANIPAELPPRETICLVTVDTISGKNVIVWEETQGKGIVGYNLYRETTSAGVFDHIAYIPVDSLSIYTDEFADPTIRSWRYKLASVNECGIESRLSPPHKTMHLTINIGLLDHINLIWNHYEGFIPLDNSYKIWRHTPGSGWEIIATVPSNLNSYTDTNPVDADLWYYVEAIHPTGCTPLKATSLNSSRSNRKSKLKASTESIGSFEDEYQLILYPNPSEGLFRLMMNMGESEDLDIKVFDLSGKLLFQDEIENSLRRLDYVIDLSNMEKGMYQLQLRTDKGVFNKTLVIQ